MMPDWIRRLFGLRSIDWIGPSHDDWPVYTPELVEAIRVLSEVPDAR